MGKEKKSMRDPARMQKRVAAVLAVVLCAALMLSLVAGMMVY